jgi:hypothetical protein
LADGSRILFGKKSHTDAYFFLIFFYYGLQNGNKVGCDHLAVRYELTDSDLREIGEFTRENVLTWMESHKGVDWFDTLTWGPIHDFHAVCGDIDTPWGAEEGRSFWTTVTDKATLRYTTKWRS